jgi:hypothetical protein
MNYAFCAIALPAGLPCRGLPENMPARLAPARYSEWSGRPLIIRGSIVEQTQFIKPGGSKSRIVQVVPRSDAADYVSRRVRRGTARPF